MTVFGFTTSLLPLGTAFSSKRRAPTTMPAERPDRPSSSHLRHVLRGIVSRRVTPFRAVDPLHVREVALTLQQLDENALQPRARESIRERRRRGKYIYSGASCSGDEVLTENHDVTIFSTLWIKYEISKMFLYFGTEWPLKYDEVPTRFSRQWALMRL